MRSKFLPLSDDLNDPEFLKAVIEMIARNGVGDWRRGAFLMTDVLPRTVGQSGSSSMSRSSDPKKIGG